MPAEMLPISGPVCKYGSLTLSACHVSMSIAVELQPTPGGLPPRTPCPSHHRISANMESRRVGAAPLQRAWQDLVKCWESAHSLTR